MLALRKTTRAQFLTNQIRTLEQAARELDAANLPNSAQAFREAAQKLRDELKALTEAEQQQPAFPH
jgi:uncharacterized membrane protein YccC